MILRISIKLIFNSVNNGVVKLSYQTIKLLWNYQIYQVNDNGAIDKILAKSLRKRDECFIEKPTLFIFK